jgi:hypothetical protein
MPQGKNGPVGPNWEIDVEVPKIVEHILKKFSTTFPRFNKDAILFLRTQRKQRKPLRLIPCRYPFHIITEPYCYVIETSLPVWEMLEQKQKNLAVFHIMCAIPDGGFDVDCEFFVKKRRYDYELYDEEYGAAGGIPNWMDDPDAARDPLTIKGKVKKAPITKQAIEQL